MNYPKPLGITIWWRKSKTRILVMTTMGMVLIAGFVAGIIYDNRPPRCEICSVHAENQIDIFWLCDRDYSETRMLARKELGIAYSLKDFSYVESNMDILPVQLRIIRGRIK